MTEKILGKLRLGAENLEKKYKNTDQVVKNIKRENLNIRKKTWEDKLDAGFEEAMKWMFSCGVVMLLLLGVRIVSDEFAEKVEKVKEEKEKIEIIEEKEQIPEINPIIMNMNQRVRE